MSTLESAAGVVGELDAWVTWLVDTYELWQRIPVCWAEHPACVAELTALYDYRNAVETFQGKTPLDDSLVIEGWHDYLGRAVDRLRTSACGDCVSRSQRGTNVSHRSGKTWPTSGQ